MLASLRADDPRDPVLLQKLGSSDVVFLLHDASRPSTLESIKSTWLPLVKTAFGADRTKSAVIIRSKNDLFSGVNDYRLRESNSHPQPVTTDGRVLDQDLAVSQDGTMPLFTNTDSMEKEDQNDSHSNDMSFSYMGVDITQPDKFSVEELEIGKAYSFISALSM